MKILFSIGSWKFYLYIYIFQWDIVCFKQWSYAKFTIPKIWCPHAKQQAFDDWSPRVMFLDLYGFSLNFYIKKADEHHYNKIQKMV